MGSTAAGMTVIDRSLQSYGPEGAHAPSVPDRAGNHRESRFRAGTSQHDGP